MNINELKKLKKELEQTQKFMVINNLSKECVESVTSEKTITEFEFIDKTDEIAKQCEEFIERIVKFLSKKSIPYDQIKISSSIGLICKPEFVEKLRQFYNTNMFDYNTYFGLLDRMDNQISHTYIPVSFSLNVFETGMEYMSLDEYELETGISHDEISKFNISGIINYEEFILKMDNLGYKMELLNYGNRFSFSDYIQTIKENGTDTALSIVVDLGREKHNEKTYYK